MPRKTIKPANSTPTPKANPSVVLNAGKRYILGGVLFEYGKAKQVPSDWETYLLSLKADNHTPMFVREQDFIDRNKPAQRIAPPKIGKAPSVDLSKGAALNDIPLEDIPDDLREVIENQDSDTPDLGNDPDAIQV